MTRFLSKFENGGSRLRSAEVLLAPRLHRADNGRPGANVNFLQSLFRFMPWAGLSD
jgi:hypothetical protein